MQRKIHPAIREGLFSGTLRMGSAIHAERKGDSW